ncbi:MAG: phosphate/phosphonate ABC transporter permease, partial [Betaproteobacteria bacterium]|nr:phosphate/phosphonate ABC transporter permease [Betaproteobacteria bacterium]
YFVFRRVAEIARCVPEVVYALIFVVAFGIGPFAGFLALTVHATGALGKLFAEANENIDESQLDGVRASGGNWFEVIRFAVLPQVLPNFTTYILWRLELSIRSAAIVGFVGAGGIGQELYKAIGLNYYEDVSAIVLMVVLTIMIIDLLCEKIRHRMIGKENLQ